MLISNKLEQSEYKLEKNIGIQKPTGKVWKLSIPLCSSNAQCDAAAIHHFWAQVILHLLHKKLATLSQSRKCVKLLFRQVKTHSVY